MNVLDAMSSRTCDTVHMFYVRANQTNAEDIVRNALNENNLSPHFFEFIHSLGWPINVHKHPGIIIKTTKTSVILIKIFWLGWTGHTSTSWKVSENQGSIENQPNRFDGQNKVLYWADALSEIAFVLPSQIKIPEGQPDQSGGSLHSKNIILMS